MRFNANGDLVAGVGPLSVNRVQVGTGFNPRWNGDDAFLVNAPDNLGIYKLCEGLRASWTPIPVVLPGGVTNVGASRIACGAGNFVVEVATAPATVYGSWNGQPIPDWMAALHPLDGDATGRLLFASSTYTQIVIVAPDGSQTQYTVGANWDLDSARLTPSGFCYMDYSRPNTVMVQQSSTVPFGSATVDTAFNPYVFSANNTWWVLYHNIGTYLQQLNATKGYAFPASYNPDVFVQGNQATVATTPSAAEDPATISLTVIPVLGQNMVPLGTPPPDPKPPDPNPKPPDPKPPVHVKSVVILR